VLTATDTITDRENVERVLKRRSAGNCFFLVPDAILETEIFCCQYLNINNSCNKLYFLMKFGNSVADIFIIKHTQFG